LITQKVTKLSGIKIFQTIEKTRLSYEVAHQIVQLISEGRLQEGDSLPPARELATQMSVSRPILQEALSILQIQGYVSIRHGKGVFVKDPNSDILNVPIEAWLKENMKFVEDFYQARLAVEPICAHLAAKNAKPQDIANLRKLINKAEPLFNGTNASVLVGLDIDFHAMIAQIANNEFLQKMLNAVITPEYDIRKVVLRLPNHQKVTHNDHAEIFNAIADRNPVKAQEAMVTALNRPITAIREFMEDKG